MKKRLVVLIVILIGIITGINIYLNRAKVKYIKLISDKKYNHEIDRELLTQKLKGVTLQRMALLQENTVSIYGSSELQDPFIDDIFRDGRGGFFINKAGRGFCKDLQFAVEFAAFANELKGKKVVISLSPEWFNKHGLVQRHFAMNFSELQFYEAMFNGDVSDSIKKRIAGRVMELRKMNFDKIYAFLVYYDNPVIRILKEGLKPLFRLRYKYLMVKDMKAAYLILKDGQDKTVKKEIIDWEKEKRESEEECKAKSNNDFFVDDVSYKKKEKKEFIFGANVVTEKSKEFEDLQLVLDLCKEKGISPLFIIAPFHGKYSDKYKLGQSKEERKLFYKKAAEMVKKYNFDVADLSSYEYEPYFLHDYLHMSRKGWTIAAEEIEKYYNKK